MTSLRRGALVAATCLFARGGAQENFTAMEFVIPLYVPPLTWNGSVSSQWQILYDTAASGATAYGILNPASGPGNETAENYPATIEYVQQAGAKLLCYVATSYGAKTARLVQAEILAYETYYSGACGGVFFDEAPAILGNYSQLYSLHNSFAHATFDEDDEEARVVFNPGLAADELYFNFSPPAEVVGFENYYAKVRQLGMPETSDVSTPSQNMLLVHSATELADTPELIQPFVNKAYCKGWGTMYATDDLFDTDGNPWDATPSFWALLLEAAANIPTVDSCAYDALKVLVPLLGSDDSDTDAVIAAVDPSDYGDRVAIALNVTITDTGESTDRAANIRDAGAKVLCYIESEGYESNLDALQGALTTYYLSPLNDICAGFFFGGFDLVSAMEDITGLQSLYAVTQNIFAQGTVVFAPNPQSYASESDSSEYSLGFDYSLSYEYDDSGVDGDDDTAAGSESDSGLFLPWGDVLSESDVVTLAETLALGLADGAANGDIIVADILNASECIPTVANADHKAAFVVNFDGDAEDVMYELYDKEWSYGYVTNFGDFEFLATQWEAVVSAAIATESSA